MNSTLQPALIDHYIEQGMTQEEAIQLAALEMQKIYKDDSYLSQILTIIYDESEEKEVEEVVRYAEFKITHVSKSAIMTIEFSENVETPNRLDLLRVLEEIK